MSAKVFVDSNVWLYMANDESPEKKSVSIRLLERSVFISPQVLFECINVCRKKLRLSDDTAFIFAEQLLSTCELVAETANVVHKALRLCRTGSFQPYDAKIVASALEAGCTILYSEDMQHKLVIDKTLTIINPFV